VGLNLLLFFRNSCPLIKKENYAKTDGLCSLGKFSLNEKRKKYIIVLFVARKKIKNSAILKLCISFEIKNFQLNMIIRQKIKLELDFFYLKF